MKGFSNKDNDIKYKIESIINQEEVGKLIRKYKKLRKFKKSNIRTINKLDGKEDIIDKLVNEYMENDSD